PDHCERPPRAARRCPRRWRRLPWRFHSTGTSQRRGPQVLRLAPATACLCRRHLQYMPAASRTAVLHVLLPLCSLWFYHLGAVLFWVQPSRPGFPATWLFSNIPPLFQASPLTDRSPGRARRRRGG